MLKLLIGYMVMLLSTNLVIMELLSGNILGLVWSIPGVIAWYIVKDIKIEVVKPDGNGRLF